MPKLADLGLGRNVRGVRADKALTGDRLDLGEQCPLGLGMEVGLRLLQR